MIKKKIKLNSGQTLIETLAAIFILTMGVTASVGLANFALQSTTSVSKQIIATGLAREGIEAVKNMRDTNWLQQIAIDTDCYNFFSNDQTGKCYKDWLGDKNLNVVAFCLNPTNGSNNCHGNGGGTGSYYLGFDYTHKVNKPENPYWVLSDAGGSNYGLLFRNSPVSFGYYYPGSTNAGVACSNGVSGISDYCRKIILTLDFAAPYNHPSALPYQGDDLGPRLKVRSIVWWKDKNCPRSADVPSNGKCTVEFDEYLTNWKNY